MKALRRWLVVLVATTVLCGGASAATLVVNCSTVSGPTELVAASVLCPQFNLGGQTLSSISIGITGGITGSLTLTNSSTTAQTMVETTSSQISVGALSGFTFVNPVFSPSFTTGNRTLAAGQTLTVAGFTANGSGTIGPDTTNFSPYVGAGNFTVPVSTATSSTVIAGGGFAMAAAATSANATAVVTYTYAPTAPDLSIAKSHSGNFTQGQIGAQYTLTASNSGNAPTSGTVTVVDSLPSGLTPTGAAGSGWSCGINLQVVTCTSSAVVGASGTYPAITLTVNVALNAPPSVINAATVSGGGQINTANDTAADPTTVADRVEFHGDFNGDGKDDVLLRHLPTGGVGMWIMNGSSITLGTFVGSAPTSLTLVGVADFNGDGKADILWRDPVRGDVGMWLMNGATITGGAYVGAADPSLQMVGLADFNGDGRADILWRHPTLGIVGMWFMNGGTIIGGGSPGTVDPALAVGGVGDFNGDGFDDILWRHRSNGDVGMWMMNGVNIIAGGLVGGADPNLMIAGIGDYNGDLRGDILWRHPGTGDVAVWFLSSTAIIGGGYIAGSPTVLIVASVGDYNGDGKADVLWNLTGTGDVGMWQMNGTTITAGSYVAGTGSGYEFH